MRKEIGVAVFAMNGRNFKVVSQRTYYDDADKFIYIRCDDIHEKIHYPNARIS